MDLGLMSFLTVSLLKDFIIHVYLPLALTNKVQEKTTSPHLFPGRTKCTKKYSVD